MMKRLLLVLGVVAGLLASGTVGPFPAQVARALPTASGALSPSPLNNKFTTGVALVSTPTNWNFESGLTGWTTSGGATTLSGGQSGNYLSLSSSGQADSSAFTVSSSGTTFTFYLKGTDYAAFYVATSPYTSWTTKFFGAGTASWAAKNIDLSSYSGQTVKVRYRTFGTNGFDEGAGRNQTPNWTAVGAPVWSAGISVPATTASLGDYSNGATCTGSAVAAATSTGTWLNNNDSVTSSPFTIPADAGRMSFHFSASGIGPAATISLYLASESYATQHVLYNRALANGQGIYTSCAVSSWAGQTAKVKIAGSFGGSLGVINGGELTSFNALVSDEEVSVVSGLPTIRDTDVTIPGKGIALDFTRTYAPGGAVQQGSLGWGWIHTYDAKLTLMNNGDVLVRYPGGPQALFTNSGGTLAAPQGLTDTLVKNGDNTYTLTTKSGPKMNFDTAGKLANLKDRNNNTTTIAYNGSGFISTVTDPGSRQFTFTTDGSGRITQVADPLSRTVGYAYDSNGDLATVTDVKGGTTTYTYSNHRLISITDQLSHTQTYTYDAANRVVEQQNPVGGVTCSYYGAPPAYTSTNCPGVSPAPNAGETARVDPRGNKQTTQFDTSFRPTGVRDALGYESTYTYEATGALCSPANNGNRCSLTDPLGHTTSFTYDATQNVLTQTDAYAKTTTYTYNSLNEVLTATDPLGHVTTNTYDSNGNLISVTNALSQATTYTPNSDGTLASATDALSHTASFTYDSYGNVLTQTDPLSHAATYTYDLGGRKLTATDALSHAATYTYDNMNQVLTVTDPLSNVTTTAYNAKGLRTSTTDANSKTTSFAYDAADRLTTVTDPLSQTVTYAYDANGNRTSMTDTRGKTTTYVYDALNRVTSVTDPLSRVTTYAYDGAGRRTSQTDAKSQTTAYAYDNVNRLSGVDYPAGTPDVSVTYDDAGRALTMVDGTGTTTATYDVLNRPTYITDGAGNVVGYGYDAAGRRTAIAYPGSTGSVAYAYDAASRLTSVTDWLSMATSYTYDNANRLTSTTLGNGLISDRTYDNANRLLTLVNRNGGTTISSYTYSVDNVGNRSQVVDTTGTTAYSYDGLYRLTGVTYPNTDVQSYTYDQMGNRLTKVHNGTTTAYTYDDAGQMTAAGGTSYTYDNDGNTSAAGSDTYAWDAANRLAGTTLGGVTSTYAYNGGGLRTSRTIGGVTTTYAWDLTGSLPNVLQDNTGNKYVYGLDLISMTNGTTQEYYLTDGLGSTTGISDGSGSVTGTYEYDAFGAVRAQSGVTTEWSYTGEQNDPTGLEYLRARYYDASTGRFLSQDPVPLLQRYAYANGNPANLVDPSGLSTAKDAHDALVARFAQLMDSERELVAIAKQILADPCWKTHAFCKHVAFVWKKVKEAAWDCAKGAAGGAVVGGAIGLAGGGAGLGAGMLAGAMWGCAGSIAAGAAEDMFGAMGGVNGFAGNAGAQCGFAAVAAAGTYFSATRGGSATLARAGLGAAGGCVGGAFGWFAKTVMSHDPDANGGADTTAQCSLAGGTALAFALGRGNSGLGAFTQGVGACSVSGVVGAMLP
jgi:RHS repeat-associated protein